MLEIGKVLDGQGHEYATARLDLQVCALRFVPTT